MMFDGQGYFVDAFVDSAASHNLCTKDAAVGGRKHEFERKRGGTRIVAGMVVGVNRYALVIDVPLLKPLGRQTGGGYGEIEHLGYGSADGAFV